MREPNFSEVQDNNTPQCIICFEVIDACKCLKIKLGNYKINSITDEGSAKE